MRQGRSTRAQTQLKNGSARKRKSSGSCVSTALRSRTGGPLSRRVGSGPLCWGTVCACCCTAARAEKASTRAGTRSVCCTTCSTQHRIPRRRPWAPPLTPWRSAACVGTASFSWGQPSETADSPPVCLNSYGPIGRACMTSSFARAAGEPSRPPATSTCPARCAWPCRWTAWPVFAARRLGLGRG